MSAPTTYYDIEFGGTSSGYSDYTTICQQIESIEVQNPQTEFYLTNDFTIGSGKVIAILHRTGYDAYYPKVYVDTYEDTKRKAATR